MAEPRICGGGGEGKGPYDIENGKGPASKSHSLSLSLGECSVDNMIVGRGVEAALARPPRAPMEMCSGAACRSNQIGQTPVATWLELTIPVPKVGALSLSVRV